MKSNLLLGACDRHWIKSFCKRPSEYLFTLGCQDVGRLGFGGTMKKVIVESVAKLTNIAPSPHS